MGFVKVTDNEYHQGEWRSWVGSSHLKVANTDMTRYYNQFVAPANDDDEKSDALILGSLVHALALEGEGAASVRFAELPASINRKTKIGKAQYSAFMLDNAHRDVVKESSWDQARAMAASLAGNDSFRAQLEKSNWVEAAYFWEEDTVKQKIKPDLVNAAEYTFSDVKTTRDPRGFHADSFRFGYHLSMAHYEAGLQSWRKTDEPWDHILFVVDKQSPYTVYERDFTGNALDVGRGERTRALARLKEAFGKDDWSEPDAAPRSLGVPDWYTQGLESPECFAF